MPPPPRRNAVSLPSAPPPPQGTSGTPNPLVSFVTPLISSLPSIPPTGSPSSTSATRGKLKMEDREFEELVIAVTGTFPGFKHAGLKEVIERLGATFSERITPKCTHLLATEAEVKANGHKFIRACDVYDCQIVSLKWLEDSWTQEKPLLADLYLLPPKAVTGDSAIPAEEVADKKRCIEEALGVSDYEERKKQRLMIPEIAMYLDLKIPPSEACPSRYGWWVYIGSDSVYDAAMVQTSAGGKKNSSCHLQLLRNSKREYRVWEGTARIGEAVQTTLNYRDTDVLMSKMVFNARFKHKTGRYWENRNKYPPRQGKFQFIERSYEDLDIPEDYDDIEGMAQTLNCTLLPEVQDVMRLIFNKDNFESVTRSISYDPRKFPLGPPNQGTLTEGYLALKELSELIAKYAEQPKPSDYQVRIKDLSTKYFSRIPHVFGRNPVPIIDNPRYIRKELGVISDLANIAIANGIMESARTKLIHPLDCQFRALGLDEMTPLDCSSTEYNELQSYFKQGPNVSPYKITGMFRIRRHGEESRFTSSRYSRLEKSNRRLLWHGSRNTNFAGILSEGLRVTPFGVPTHGATLGKGVYFADVSAMSLSFSRQTKEKRALLLLCDVELGSPMNEIDGARYGTMRGKKPPAGTIATRFRGDFCPTGWKDAACIHSNLQGVKVPKYCGASSSTARSYSEYVVHDPAQIQMRYLFLVEQKVQS